MSYITWLRKKHYLMYILLTSYSRKHYLMIIFIISLIMNNISILVFRKEISIQWSYLNDVSMIPEAETRTTKRTSLLNPLMLLWKGNLHRFHRYVTTGTYVVRAIIATVRIPVPVNPLDFTCDASPLNASLQIMSCLLPPYYWRNSF